MWVGNRHYEELKETEGRAGQAGLEADVCAKDASKR